MDTVEDSLSRMTPALAEPIPRVDSASSDSAYPTGAAEASWFTSTRDALNDLPRKTSDVAFGGARTQESAVRGMLTILVRTLHRSAPPPAVVPTWDGGVQVEWHRNGVDLEIEVDADGQSEFFFSGPEGEIEGQVREDFDLLSQCARAIL